MAEEARAMVAEIDRLTRLENDVISLLTHEREVTRYHDRIRTRIEGRDPDKPDHD